MDEKKGKLRKRDLALQAFFMKVQGLIKELESKYPELVFIEEARNGESGKAKNRG
ncbi:MAG TPA: hypothetical protein VMW09_01720 [Desulfatiglandales bacterium]|nr:hypothetical protein [Desulfatiglandales bacterium]